jgi:hypothetical protein
MLSVPDMWTVFDDQYLDALDQVALAEAANPKPKHPWAFPDADYAPDTGPASSLSGMPYCWSG